MVEGIFIVTIEDLSLLDRGDFDQVWNALRLIVWHRTLALRPPVSEPRANIPDSIPEPAAVAQIEEHDAAAILEATAAPDPEPVADPAQDSTADLAELPIVVTPAEGATARKAARPLGVTVPCEPGCGKEFTQEGIAAHRRECEAVARFREERGVRIVPSLESAVPLPPVPASDFAEKRIANARAATDATWQRLHPNDPERGAKPETNGTGLALTDNQQRVLDALRKTSGKQADANEVLGYERQSARVAATISRLRETNRLPVDVEELLRAGKRPPRKAAHL